MDATELTQSMAAGGNFFGVFLCTGALATLRERGSDPELNALLGRGLATYAPVFRRMQEVLEGASDVEPALERLEVLVRLGMDFDAPADVAELRAAVRELLQALGFELPERRRSKHPACELHGATCPEFAPGAAAPVARRRRSRRGASPAKTAPREARAAPARRRRGARRS